MVMPAWTAIRDRSVALVETSGGVVVMQAAMGTTSTAWRGGTGESTGSSLGSCGLAVMAGLYKRRRCWNSEGREAAPSLLRWRRRCELVVDLLI
ncbi:hypothetical protein M0R45_030123 [Rubus argutus]|uniref:Uncharacterized protein n=1 Tax=Rubus argutus TaxID=59490 RepID=A0AAW1WCA5_RUBAR